MDHDEQTHPFVADVRWAAGAVQRAVDSASRGEAPLSTCRACSKPFYFLAAEGLVLAEGELCPACEPEVHHPAGLALDRYAVDRAVADRRGLLSVARWVAADRRCEAADAVAFLEHVEAHEERFRDMLGLARKVVVDPAEVWRAAYLAWTLGLAAAAANDPVAARMARLAATARPEAVVRCVVKARGRKLYDGAVTPECGRAIREGEQEHGRKLRVKLFHADGTTTIRRGERDTAPENRFDDTALGGVRAMMAEVMPTRLGGVPVASHAGPPMTLADVRSEQRTQARLAAAERREQALAAVPRCPYCHGAREPFGRAWRCVACETTFDQIGIQPAPLPANGPLVIAFFLAPR